jgi:hypothetical protein
VRRRAETFACSANCHGIESVQCAYAVGLREADAFAFERAATCPAPYTEIPAEIGFEGKAGASNKRRSGELVPPLDAADELHVGKGSPDSSAVSTVDASSWPLTGQGVRRGDAVGNNRRP